MRENGHVFFPIPSSSSRLRTYLESKFETTSDSLHCPFSVPFFRYLHIGFASTDLRTVTFNNFFLSLSHVTFESVSGYQLISLRNWVSEMRKTRKPHAIKSRESCPMTERIGRKLLMEKELVFNCKNLDWLLTVCDGFCVSDALGT